MRKIILLLLFVFISGFSKSQYHELGMFIGASNYVGDIGSDYYIMPETAAIGLIYKWNVTTRYSLRFSAITSKLEGTDYRTDDLNRFGRAYSFSNNLKEGSIGIEFNFLDFNLHDQETINFSPYLYLGLSIIEYDEFYFNSTQIPVAKQINFNKTQGLSIPINFGVKINPSPYWVLGAEIGARYALNDNLDGSSPKGQGDNQGVEYFSFGSNNNDWYIFTGITISFTFGDLPCYCKEE